MTNKPLAALLIATILGSFNPRGGFAENPPQDSGSSTHDRVSSEEIRQDSERQQQAQEQARIERLKLLKAAFEAAAEQPTEMMVLEALID